MAHKSITDEITELKAKNNALILAHYYEDGDIQDIADHVGDSLFLAQVGEKAENPVVLLAGVKFMAESVKILSPNKKVLIPDMEAGCSLVNESPFDKYLQWRIDHPNGIAVTYVNSSADVKAISDVICTSSNAEKILNAIPEDREILFGPDQNLGRYLAKKAGRKVTLWPGSCEVHILFSSKKMFELKQKHPKAIVLAHPECEEPVLELADVIGSTSRLLNEVTTNPAKEFIVATEPHIFHQMKKNRPDAILIEAPPEGDCGCNNCPYMELNTLEKVKLALNSLNPEVTVDPKVSELASVSLRRMMDITNDKPVSWPEKFKVPPIFNQ